MVRKKSDKQLYALKYINKEQCIQKKAARNTIFERNLLVQLDYPLIVNLRYAFQDDETMFMVLDLMLGGDLKYHLQQTGSFPEEAVRVYAAEMICAIEYLQTKRVVHRDIKPDNLLLDEEGHIHLTDFNVATYLPEDGSPLKSFSGTLTYMGTRLKGW